MIDQTLLQLLDTLSLPVAALIAVGFLWRALNSVWGLYLKDLQTVYGAHLADLRSFKQDQLADMKVAILMIEDRLGLPHKMMLGDDDKPHLSIPKPPTSHKAP